jgi:hypothetical protein
MLDEQFQEQCRQFRSFSKQSEKSTCFKEDISDTGYAIRYSSSRRTRTTLRSSLSLCFTSTSLASQMDFA